MFIALVGSFLKAAIGVDSFKVLALAVVSLSLVGSVIYRTIHPLVFWGSVITALSALTQSHLYWPAVIVLCGYFFVEARIVDKPK